MFVTGMDSFFSRFLLYCHCRESEYLSFDGNTQDKPKTSADNNTEKNW